MSIEDDLFEFFKKATLLIKTDINKRNKRKKLISQIYKIIVEDSYIPFITPDKLEYSVQLPDVFPELAQQANKILGELRLTCDLPDSYKVAVVMGLSLIVLFRWYYERKISDKINTTVVIEESQNISVSLRALLSLYLFILSTKSGGKGIDPLDFFLSISDYENKDADVANELKNNLWDKIKTKEAKSKRGQDEHAKKEQEQKRRRIYSIFNTLYLPLVLAYAFNGAGVLRYYNALGPQKQKSDNRNDQERRSSDQNKEIKQSKLGYYTTAIADRLLYLTFHADLRTAAKELVDIFSAVYKAVHNLPHALMTVNDDLISSILREVAISAIVSRELYCRGRSDNNSKKINEETKKIIEKIRKFYENITKSETKSLTLLDLLEIRPTAFPTGEEVLECQGDETKIKELVNKTFLLLTNSSIEEILTALKAGNVLFVGPPGTGKTRLAKALAEGLTGSKNCYDVYTANSLWFRNNVIGGESLEHGTVIWRSGLLIRAYVKAAKVTKGDYYYVIIDEVNRADVDKAFGELFTIISSNDPNEWTIPNSLVEEIESYKGRRDEWAEEFLYYYKKYGDNPLRKIRFIVTMNETDLRNTFYVGEAFTRRFSTVHFRMPRGAEDLEFFARDKTVPDLDKLKEFVACLRKGEPGEEKKNRKKRAGLKIPASSVERALLMYTKYLEASQKEKSGTQSSPNSLEVFSKFLEMSLGTLSEEKLKNYEEAKEACLKKVIGESGGVNKSG